MAMDSRESHWCLNPVLARDSNMAVWVYIAMRKTVVIGMTECSNSPLVIGISEELWMFHTAVPSHNQMWQRKTHQENLDDVLIKPSISRVDHI